MSSNDYGSFREEKLVSKTSDMFLESCLLRACVLEEVSLKSKKSFKMNCRFGRRTVPQRCIHLHED